jgi:hypothetical protein
VAGRLQGDSRPLRRAPVRLRVVLGVVLLAALAGSVVLSAYDVLGDVRDSVAQDSKLTSVERRHAAGDRLRLRSAPFDRFKATLHPRERYRVDVPEGARGPFITRGAVVRAYAAFFFLPAIQQPRAARVFHYRFR